MFITTTLLAIQIPIIKNLPWVLGVAFFLVFGFLDGMFVWCWIMRPCSGLNSIPRPICRSRGQEGSTRRLVSSGHWICAVSLFSMAPDGDKSDQSYIRCIFMVFWTRCRVGGLSDVCLLGLTSSAHQELEDAFDKENRRKLTRVVLNQGKATAAQGGHPAVDKKITFVPERERGRSTSPILISQLPRNSAPHHRRRDASLHQDEHGALYVKRSDSEDLIKVQRIPTLAIVHKLSEGKGVPHAFSVFLRQIPALPKVVVSQRGRYHPEN
jgi:KUP system potassium uptake protein